MRRPRGQYDEDGEWRRTCAFAFDPQRDALTQAKEKVAYEISRNFEDPPPEPEPSRDEIFVIIMSVMKGKPLPEPLRSWAGKYLFQKLLDVNVKRRGRKRAPWRRDVFIANMIAGLTLAYGINATKNRETTTKESAASIVCTALKDLGIKLGEAQVERVYLKWHRKLLEGWQENAPAHQRENASLSKALMMLVASASSFEARQRFMNKNASSGKECDLTKLRKQLAAVIAQQRARNAARRA